jgi:hypothetical protein
MTNSMTIMPGGISPCHPHLSILTGCSGSTKAGGRTQAPNMAIHRQPAHPARGSGPDLT